MIDWSRNERGVSDTGAIRRRLETTGGRATGQVRSPRSAGRHRNSPAESSYQTVPPIGSRVRFVELLGATSYDIALVNPRLAECGCGGASVSLGHACGALEAAKTYIEWGDRKLDD